MEKISLPNGDDYFIKEDSYQLSRGRSRIYEIFCSICDELLLIYQKDGPGPLIRCYLDRIAWPTTFSNLSDSKPKLRQLDEIVHPKCGGVIATPMIYAKEDRLAFLMNHDAFIIKPKKQKSSS